MAIIKCRIEVWDRTFRKYRIVWQGSREYADTMMNKPYIMRHTRRLIQTTEEVLYTEKADKYVSE